MNAVQRGSSELPDEIRVYESWQGSNIFLFSGRFIFGPDARSVALSILLIVAPITVFCVFVARKLMDDYPNHWGITIMVIPAIGAFYDIFLLLLTSGRDPGIIPRNAHPPEPEGYEGASEGTPQLRLPRIKEVVVNGISVKIKYCDTCMLYRPPRCSHCSICNNCVERFDHHCPWVGQCIGRRNYRFFFMFVFTTTLLCIYLFAFCWVYIKRIMVSEEISIWRAMIKTPASMVLIIYTFISVWFVGGLTAFHLYLISTNQTTYENFRYRYDRRANPYNRGTIDNFKEIFCVPIPPSKNDFRAKIPIEPIVPTRRYLPETMDHMMSRKEANGDDRHDGQLSQLRDNNRFNTKDGGLGSLSPEVRSTVDESDRVGTHSSWGRKSGSWEMSPEVVSLSARMAEANRNGGTSSIIRSAEPRR